MLLTSKRGDAMGTRGWASRGSWPACGTLVVTRAKERVRSRTHRGRLMPTAHGQNREDSVLPDRLPRGQCHRPRDATGDQSCARHRAIPEPRLPSRPPTAGRDGVARAAGGVPSGGLARRWAPRRGALLTGTARRTRSTSPRRSSRGLMRSSRTTTSCAVSRA